MFLRDPREAPLPLLPPSPPPCSSSSSLDTLSFPSPASSDKPINAATTLTMSLVNDKYKQEKGEVDHRSEGEPQRADWVAATSLPEGASYVRLYRLVERRADLVHVVFPSRFLSVLSPTPFLDKTASILPEYPLIWAPTVPNLTG